jgi:hypothetical protein
VVVCDEGRFLSFSRSWPRAFWRSAENVRRVAQAAACVVGIRALCHTAPSETLSVALFFATFRRAPTSQTRGHQPLPRYTATPSLSLRRNRLFSLTLLCSKPTPRCA